VERAAIDVWELGACLSADQQMAGEHSIGRAIGMIRLREYPYVANPRMGSEVALERRARLTRDRRNVLLPLLVVFGPPSDRPVGHMPGEGRLLPRLGEHAGQRVDAGSLPLVPVQRAANAVNAAERPLAATNARFTALDWLVVVLGGLCVALAVLGTFVPA